MVFFEVAYVFQKVYSKSITAIPGWSPEAVTTGIDLFTRTCLFSILSPDDPKTKHNFPHTLWEQSNLASVSLERFPIERRKTKAKVITTANQNKGKFNKEPIRTQSKYTKTTSSAGKRK